MELDNLLIRLLVMHDNETTTLSKDSYHNYEKLIIELSRIKYGIRYHKYDRECNCQPECIIKEILKKDDELNEFLNNNGYLKEINKIIKEKINKNKTIWGDDE